ncbi:MAG: lysylphosphatidylglycerol synthase transmembrane domain-containing protein [Armatimonadota bacterium]
MTSPTADVSRPSSRPRAILKRLAAAIVVAALLAWVLHRAWTDAQTIDPETLQMRPGLICLSVPVAVLAWTWQAILWKCMLDALGHPVHTWTAIRASIVGNMGNYIPGKVFIVILRGKLLAQDGVPMVIVASTVVLESLLRNMAAAVLSVIGLWQLGVGRSYVGPLVVLLLASVVVVHPAIFNRLIDFVLRKLKRPPLPHRLNAAQLAGLLAGYAVYWGILAVAFFLLTKGTLGAEWTAFPALSVALLISLIASVMAVFTPVGLGVADATMAGVLAVTGVVAGAGVLAVIMRVWRTLTEVGVAGVLWLLPGGPRVDLSDAAEEEEEITVESVDR